MATLSVLITTFNGEKFISDCIHSIISQTYRDIEIIVVDDGSTDSTREIIDSISDTRLKVFSITHSGHVNALNYGISKSTSEYITIIDHDDTARKDKLEIQLAYISKNSDVGVVSHSFFVVNESQKVLYRINLPEYDQDIKSRLIYQNIISHSGVMYKKLLIQSVGGYREEYGLAADYDLWLRLIHKTNFYNIQIPLLNYRKHKSSLTNSISAIETTNYLCFKTLSENIDPKKSNKIIQAIWEVLYNDSVKGRKMLLRNLLSKEVNIKVKMKFLIMSFGGRKIIDIYYYLNPRLRVISLIKRIVNLDTLT